MQHSIFRNRAALGLLSVILASGCVAHISEPVNPEPNLTRPEAVQFVPAGTQGTEPVEKAPGIIVYIDPKSGEFTAGPTEALPAQRPQQSLASGRESVSEPQETLSPVPSGGVAVRLGQRFFTPLTATIEADGELRLEHLPSPPDSRDKK